MKIPPEFLIFERIHTDPYPVTDSSWPLATWHMHTLKASVIGAANESVVRHLVSTRGFIFSKNGRETIWQG